MERGILRSAMGVRLKGVHELAAAVQSNRRELLGATCAGAAASMHGIAIIVHCPPKGDPKRGVRPTNRPKVTFKSLSSHVKVTTFRIPLFGSPFGGRRIPASPLSARVLLSPSICDPPE